METDLEHLPHLRLVTTHEHASVVSGNILDLCDNGVDDGCFVRVYVLPTVASASTVQGVSLAKDVNLQLNACGTRAHLVDD